MSKPPRPRVTEDDVKRAYDIKEWFALNLELAGDVEREELQQLAADAEALYTKLSRIQSYSALYGHE